MHFLPVQAWTGSRPTSFLVFKNLHVSSSLVHIIWATLQFTFKYYHCLSLNLSHFSISEVNCSLITIKEKHIKVNVNTFSESYRLYDKNDLCHDIYCCDPSCSMSLIRYWLPIMSSVINSHLSFSLGLP